MNKQVFQKVVLPDGQTALVLTQNPSKQLGIVDVATVKKLAQMLPSISLSDMKEGFIDAVRNADNLQEYVATIAEEFNFHTTVNLLATYNPEDVGSDIKHEAPGRAM